MSRRARTGAKQTPLENIETDSPRQLDGLLEPQTPLGQDGGRLSPIPRRGDEPLVRWSTESQGLWKDIKTLRWVIVPSSSLKILLIVLVLWSTWELLAPLALPGVPNPFAPLLFISHRIPGTPDADPRYQKGYLDLAFIAYYIVFWSFVRQSLFVYILRPLGRRLGLKREAKVDRFGEQGYAILYFAVMGTWGIRIMSQLPTWWYRTEYFWIDYPHWEMKPELKRYYLMQGAYWCHQLLVLLLRLEKPRKDYTELVAHHFVTIWLVGWSYLINLTYIGNAVYLSMDLPDTFLAMSLLLNYIQWDRIKIAVFALFLIPLWSYFRHWLNWVILWSVWFEFDLMPETSKRWSPDDGVWMVWWMKYQVFVPLLLLQALNLFWYFLILRIAYRALRESGVKATDDRSDDEGDPEEEQKQDN
ncbi:longevity assurance proteins LAG1/LAC1 [Trametes coccinea BRFM310]|uniref:Longevity assurance proteins LAG1/LAC1 n=1 Tax=Trametes coccinea (strain BRFM310) TaxID=1353009 RepID=A0A1Y2IW93_TRAC3|nr:longevity assurance proteins LAG1/LAC1 [Trametes coccinea BRFM310]